MSSHEMRFERRDIRGERSARDFKHCTKPYESRQRRDVLLECQVVEAATTDKKPRPAMESGMGAALAAAIAARRADIADDDDDDDDWDDD